MKNKIAQCAQKGQGITEYLCALCMAALISASLMFGLQDGGWMYNAYNTLFNSAGQFLVSSLSSQS